MPPQSLFSPKPDQDVQSSSPAKKAVLQDSFASEIIFFYLGKAPIQGKLLIDSFHSGFFLQDFQRAVPLFVSTRAASPLPFIIIFNGSLGVLRLHEFYQQLPADIKRTVPIFIDITRLNDKEKLGFVKLPFVSDIISLKETSSERLLASARFICKTMASGNKSVAETRRLPVFLRSIESKEIAKRVIDILISSIAIIVLSPLFLIIALAILIESGGPVLYVSPRAGRGYRIFDFFKFRTMVPEFEGSLGQLSHLNQYGANTVKGPLFFKATNDPRITRVGAVLRSTSLDELPQFFNVLFGDMSLVGNRPLPLYEAETLTSDECAIRFLAPAGITGLWQIKKRKQSEMSAEERLGLDITYAHNNNLLYDLWIMANTPSALIQKPNA